MPWAQLYAGIAAIKERKFDVADKALAERRRRRCESGPDAARGAVPRDREELQGDAERRARAAASAREKAIENDDERTEYLAAVAYSTAAGRTSRSRRCRSSISSAGRVTPTERAVILARVEEVVAAADPNTLAGCTTSSTTARARAWRRSRAGCAIAADAAGNAAEAQKLREAAGPARAALGLREDDRRGAPRRPPGQRQPGPDRRRDAARWQDGTASPRRRSPGSGSPRALRWQGRRRDRDARRRPRPSLRAAVDDLAGKNVVAIVGPIDGASVDAASRRAEGLGVPLL